MKPNNIVLYAKFFKLVSAIITLLALMPIRVNAQSLELPEYLSFYSVPFSTDNLLVTEDIDSNYFVLQTDGSLKPLPNGKGEIKSLLPNAGVAMSTFVLQSLSVLTKIFSVNEVANRILSLANGPKLGSDGTLISTDLQWSLKIGGAVYQPVASKGSCSNIPLYEDYSVLLRYVLSINLNATDTNGVKRSSVPIQIEISDPSPIYVHTRCWTSAGKLYPSIQRQSREEQSFDKRLETISQLMNHWLTDFTDDFEDDVLTKMKPKIDSSGNFIFDKVSIKVTESTKSNLRIRWTFTPDDLTRDVYSSLSK
ncbi:MAG TPA: hypothetical protein PKL53_08205 [Methylotenera sp.]|nr:hypothetical protein [Methylotenera sp.]HPV45830.1 hypothetical protein [Methylotenera sp.]